MPKKSAITFFKKIHFLLIGFTKPIFTLFLIYIAYLLFGSLSFVVLESTNELQHRNETISSIRITQAMVRKLRDANYSDGDIARAFRNEHNKRKKTQEDLPEFEWYETYGEKFFFAFILVSTIGYGNVVPKSPLGKIVCVIYSMIGLPLHEITMRLLSVKYRGGLRRILKFGLKIFPRSRIVLIIMGILFFLFWSGIFFVIPAWLIMMSEKWAYHTAFYFSYVSLTTIGLGDYVSRVSVREHEGVIYALTLFAVIVWMFFGLGFVSMTINMLSYVMGWYTLDKLDSKCRERTEAMKKLNVLLDLMKELNWQLVKGKPDDFEDWEEIEDFRNLLTENPQDVTPAILSRMLDIIMDLKEKCYDQVHRTQLSRIPVCDLLRRMNNTIPDILSTDSFLVNKVETKKVRKAPVSPSFDQTARRIALTDWKKSASLSGTFRPSGQESSQESPESSTQPTDSLRVPSDIIEDRTEYDLKEDAEADDADEKDLNADETEEKSDDEKKNKD